jgi:hypothetical protein
LDQFWQKRAKTSWIRRLEKAGEANGTEARFFGGINQVRNTTNEKRPGRDGEDLSRFLKDSPFFIRIINKDPWCRP